MKYWWFPLITLAVFCALVKLGWWQLQRADTKQQLQQQLQQRAQRTLSWSQVQATADVAGFGLTVSVQPQALPPLLLDNRTLNGQVGYQWLQPVVVGAEAPLLLLDLGFVAAGLSRNQLPALPELPATLPVSGRLYRPGHNPLSTQAHGEPGAKIRIQAVNFEEIEQMLRQPLLPYLLFVDQPAEIGFIRHWRPISMSPDKHKGYAVQWFGLATAWLVIVYLLWRRQRPLASLQQAR
ncbi:Cytochrome oxidase assembly protein ShyY1 [Ferrimonas sediminum]|uniref:SURF1-like protein n=1 Tax=Ferrimonas sediminum TaxID=718193 RepID=A0A1G8ZKX2_9GAMM|nr:SURF1 family protein [Ferrimonas sediminum]SDK15707.1 Cytochrome oxidase assembly protein ShyY1 [Ferrimonas sediminum]